MAEGMLDRMRDTNGQQASAQRTQNRSNQQRGQRRAEDAHRAAFVQSVQPPKLKARKPRGVVPWPLILLEGEEYSGKDYKIGELGQCERVGTIYWMSVGERVPDEYDPDKYDIAVVEHDGSMGDILGQIEAVRVEGQAALDAKKPPVVLAVNSGTEVWRMLSALAFDIAAKSDKNREILAADPNADIKVGRTHWNSANRRWKRLMTALKAHPGPVVLTARGGMVSATGPNGQPLITNGKAVKEYKVEAQNQVGFETSAWVRLGRRTAPHIIGIRSIDPKIAIKAEEDKPRPMPGLTLETLIFDVLGCKVGESIAREVVEATPEDRAAELQQVRDEVWSTARRLGWDGQKLAAEYAAWAGDDQEIKGANAATLDEYLREMPTPPEPSDDATDE